MEPENLQSACPAQVTSHVITCRFLMNKVKDMQELVSMSKQQLEEILGNDANAKLLWNFLHSELETQTASAKIRSIIRSK